MKKISRKECYSRLVCIKCGKPLSTECLDGNLIDVGQRRYHLECSLEIQYTRRNNASTTRKSLGKKAKCVICGKNKLDSQLDKKGMCSACAKLVEKRINYNLNLKKRIDWETERILEKKRAKECSNSSDLKLQDQLDDGPKPYSLYNNPAAYKLDRDKTGRYASDPVTRVYDTVTEEGVAVRVECRGQVHPYVLGHK